MRKLTNDHWLKQAKLLPIGADRRIYHGAERRPNLTIRNEESCWSAYCHSCKEGAKVMKEFVKPAPPVIKHVSRHDPGLCRSLEGIQWPDVPTEKIIGFLNSKGITKHMLKPYDAKWSINDQRIVVTTPEGMIGRTMDPKVLQKWYSYRNEHGFFAANQDYDAPNIVLTEDFFSAAKVQFYAPEGYQAIALLGTVLHKALLTKLTNRRVIICTDGDDAGREAELRFRRKFELLGIETTSVLPPEGSDPKDMDKDWMYAKLFRLPI